MSVSVYRCSCRCTCIVAVVFDIVFDVIFISTGFCCIVVTIVVLVLLLLLKCCCIAVVVDHSFSSILSDLLISALILTSVPSCTPSRASYRLVTAWQHI